MVSCARCRIGDIRKRMNICDITGALDLEVRQAHHDTMEDLHCIQKVGGSGFAAGSRDVF